MGTNEEFEKWNEELCSFFINGTRKFEAEQVVGAIECLKFAYLNRAIHIAQEKQQDKSRGS